MAEYIISGTFKAKYEVAIEAESEQEAISKVKDGLHFVNVDAQRTIPETTDRTSCVCGKIGEDYTVAVSECEDSEITVDSVVKTEE